MVDLAGDNPFLRWGTDITVTDGGRELRLLSVHVVSGCWGMEQDRDEKRAETCGVLRGQMLRLKAWADAHRAEGMGFVILGDFNRRLAVPGDWAWGVLSPPSAALHLPTSDLVYGYNPRFREFIDHLVVGGGVHAGAGLDPRDPAPGSSSRSLRHGGRLRIDPLKLAAPSDTANGRLPGSS